MKTITSSLPTLTERNLNIFGEELPASLATLDGSVATKLARISGVPVWCGGMLESGVGRAHNIAMSTLPGFTLPGDVSASARYWAEDIVEPPITVSKDGTIEAPPGDGIGYNVDEARIEALTVRRAEIRL